MQRTEKYFENDAFRKTAAGVILAAEADAKTGGGRIALDGTVFYPEGGGQPADRGTLTLPDGTVLRVSDVHEQAGVIWHTVDALPAAAAPGAAVTGCIDWDWRFDKMQQHTGEHILSGILHSMFGAENVGFHIGSEAVRMDTSVPISAEGLQAAELAADDRRGIAACQLQSSGDHGGGRGLAMGTGDADALLVQTAHIAQQDAALHRRDAVGGCRIQLHIVLCDGGRVDHQVCTDDIISAVAQRDLDAHLPLGADDAAVQHIAAGQLVALGGQDLDQRIHSAAAAADKMDLLYMVQQMLAIIRVHEHSKALLQILTAAAQTDSFQT